MNETIKSFLVSLSFGVDEASLAQFNKAVVSATLKVTALAVTIKAAAAGIFYGISKISDSFEKMGYELRLISPALTKTLQLRQAMMYAYRQAGIDITKAAQQSVLFNYSLAKTKFVLEAIYKSVGLKFIPLLTKQMDVFRKNLYANMPKIQASLERFVKFIFKAFEAVVTLGMRAWSILGRIYDFFVMLDKATDGWSTVILGLIAAWRLLNLSFLATPLGMLLTGLLAILAVFDDFKTYKEGGQSLFDWSKIEPTINAAIKSFLALFEVIKSVFGIFVSIFDILKKIFTLDFSHITQAFSQLVNSLTGSFTKLTSFFGALNGLGGAAAKGLGSFFSSASNSSNSQSGGPLGAVAQAFPNANAPVLPQSVSNVKENPLGVDQVNNSTSNQKISQETNIVVQGSADANATGRAVSSEQAKVNFDLARNMKAAAR